MSNDPKVRQLFIPCSSAEAADGYEVEPFTSTGLKICSTGLTETELMFLCEHARVPPSPSAYPKKSPVLIRVATLHGCLFLIEIYDQVIGFELSIARGEMCAHRFKLEDCIKI